MWIVNLALRRPYTFVVMAILIAVMGGLSVASMPQDIFPYIDIPVASVVWAYNGISPTEMANRITTIIERAYTSTVNDIEHLESTSLNGVSTIRFYFQPNARIDLALAQLVSINQTLLRPLPPGITPPNVVKYDPSGVPILQIVIGSKSLSEQQLFDFSQNFIRTQLASVQGATIPLPYGGKSRQIMVDLDPAALYSKNLSATDVTTAVTLQNLILPAGDAKIGDRDYFVRLNSSPLSVEAMNDMPVKTVNGATIRLRDIAQVRDGFAVQSNIVRQNGRRGVLLTVLKNGQASTVDVVNRMRAILPKALAGLPPSLTATPLFDQSLFVRAAIRGLAREGLIAAGLTALMILMFLGSWRSTLVVCTSIPLSILTSCIVLWALGYTLNVMTLGGMALAVGILVDDATVDVENVIRNMGLLENGLPKPFTKAILDGTQQIALPSLVSTLAVCIVFLPVLLLTGPARFLFTPLAMAVAVAMLMSYLLSRTLVPTMIHFMLRSEASIYALGEAGIAQAKGAIWRLHHLFNQRFEKMRHGYRTALGWCLHHRIWISLLYGAFVLGSLVLVKYVGTDFFPYVDAGQLRLHVRAPEGTRLEETERVFARVEETIRHNLDASEVENIIDNIGLPTNPVNLAFGDSSTVGNFDGEILVALNHEHHRPTQEIERRLRSVFRKEFPAEVFFFQAANMTNQILNFGVPATIDVQVIGRDAEGNYKLAQELERRIALVAGAVDVRVSQPVHTPELQFDVDRLKAAQSGLTQRDVANSMLISLNSSGQIAPNQWLNPANGVSYFVAVQTPQSRMDSIDALRSTPITTPGGGNTQLLDNLLQQVRRTSTPSVVSHYNVQPVFNVLANTDQRDLGSVADDIRVIIADVSKKLPGTTTVMMRGQVETMQNSFRRLGLGVIFAILLVYLLMVVNFQSWLDPFIILTALPGAFAGILWMLYASQTTINVPSLMGSIMAIGVATANSILVVTFANDERRAGLNEVEAALSAGFTRIRPVLMTALAMVIGMVPMAFGSAEGSEQNAPLGRAVIGGLVLATFSTLFFVPVLYSVLRRKTPVDMDRQIELETRQPQQGSAQ